MNIEIIRATQAQSEQIALLCASMGYEASADEVSTRLHLILTDPNHRFFVARVEGEIVGFCHGYVRNLVEVPQAVEIGGLSVLEKAQGKGVGKKLVSAIESWAKEVGVKAVVLSSNVIRTEAHKFYEHLGYVIIKQQHAFQKNI